MAKNAICPLAAGPVRASPDQVVGMAIPRVFEPTRRLSARIRVASAAAQALDAMLLISGNLARQRHTRAHHHVRDRREEFLAAVPTPKVEPADDAAFVAAIGDPCDLAL